MIRFRIVAASEPIAASRLLLMYRPGDVADPATVKAFTGLDASPEVMAALQAAIDALQDGQILGVAGEHF